MPRKTDEGGRHARCGGARHDQNPDESGRPRPARRRDAATIAILHHRAALEARVVNEQLQQALTSRVIIEQAKGILAERAGIAMDHALSALRRYSRANNERLGVVAGSIIDGTLDTAVLLAEAPPPAS